MYEHWLGEPKIVPSKLTKQRESAISFVATTSTMSSTGRR